MEKLPECLDKPEVIREIYADNAILKTEDFDTQRMLEYRGLKEIENWIKEGRKYYRRIGISINSIEKESDTAQVKYKIDMADAGTDAEYYKYSCTAMMVKIGPKWKIKDETINVGFK